MANQNDNLRQESANWSDCPQGELAGLVGELRDRSSRRRVTRRTALLAGAAVATAGTWTVLSEWMGEPDYGGIHCTRVRELYPSYESGRIEPALAAKIDTHLMQCDVCRQLLVNVTIQMRRTDDLVAMVAKTP